MRSTTMNLLFGDKNPRRSVLTPAVVRKRISVIISH